jgi:hypothetical protein
MNQINQQVEIQWPVTALFNYVSDITNNAAWLNDVSDAEWISRTDNRVGSTFREIRKSDGERLEAEITEFIPDKKRTVKTESIMLSMDFIQVSREQTRLVMQMQWNEEVGENNLSKVVQQDLLKLKEILECNDY